MKTNDNGIQSTALDIFNLTENDTFHFIKHCAEVRTPREYYEYGRYVFFVCPPICILLNIAVLFIIYKNVKVHDRYSQWFVIGFTVSDLIWALTLMGTSPFQPSVNSLPRLICKPYFTVKFYFNITMVMFIFCLNVNRFVKLFLPLKYHRFISKRTTYLQIAFVLLVPLAFLLYLTTTLKYQFGHIFSCRIWASPVPYICMLVFFYSSPLLISFVISICIFILAQNKSMEKNDGHAGGGMLLKRILFVFSYTVWTSITQLPYRLYYIQHNIQCHKYSVIDNPLDAIQQIHNDGKCNDCENKRYLLILLCLVPVCSILNPVITIITQKQYRKGLQKFGHVITTTSLLNLSRLSNHNVHQTNGETFV